jgi:hypothetical protein
MSYSIVGLDSLVLDNEKSVILISLEFGFA